MVDLQAGTLRHCTDAFREDPVRILRVARFSARFHRVSDHPGHGAVDAGDGPCRGSGGIGS
jgi:hypothetical protein